MKGKSANAEFMRIFFVTDIIKLGTGIKNFVLALFS